MTTKNLKGIIARLADQQQRLFFYEGLKNPKLFDELCKIGVYNDPPIIRQEDGRAYYPLWPQARYLVNIAGDIPEKVAKLVQELDVTNPSVASDLCRAILKMPPSIVKSLLRPLRSWTDIANGMLLYSLLDIIDHLAQGSEMEAAIKLGYALLEIRPGKTFDLGNSRRICAVAKIDGSRYSFVLNRVLKATSHREPQKTLKMLSVLLAKSLEIEGLIAKRDFSSHWIPNLSENPIGSGVKKHLAHRLFMTALTSAKDGDLPLDSIYIILDGNEGKVFRRIKIALESEFGDEKSAKIEFHEDSFYAEKDLKRERAALLYKFYPSLNINEKTEVMYLLRAAVTSKEVARKHFGHQLQGSDLERAITDAHNEELYQELKILEPYLIGSDAEEFASLKERFSRDEEREPKDGKVWIGPTSPKSLKELETMSTPEILSYASTWIPRRGWFEHTPEGFGRCLEPLVAMRSGEFLGSADAILRLHPTYVRHIVNGLRQRVRDTDFDFSAFITILEYGLLRKQDAYTGVFDPLDDLENYPSWFPLQQTIAFALTDLFISKQLPISLRERAFSILTAVLKEPDPTSESDEKYGGESSYGQPWQLALNSARGAGALALFDYARWIYTACGVKSASGQLIDAAPEIFEALELLLDPAIEATRAVRSTIGKNFVSIYAMSRDWTRSRIEQIFSADELGQAAWRAYIVFDRAYNEIYVLLEDHYARSVESLEKEGDEQEGWDTNGNLGIHLATAYLQGLICLEGSLLETYIRKASSELVGHALTALGNTLITKDELSHTMLDLSTSLYDLTLSVFSDRLEESRYKALESFGIWVQSSHLPQGWTLDRLIRTLRLTKGRIAWETPVIETLQKLSTTHPMETSQALYELTVGSYSTIFMTDEPIRVILQCAIRAGGAALEVAMKTNDRFADMGITRYNELFEANP